MRRTYTKGTRTVSRNRRGPVQGQPPSDIVIVCQLLATTSVDTKISISMALGLFSSTHSAPGQASVSVSRGVASATWPGSPGPIGAPHTTHPGHGDALRPMWRIGEDLIAGAPGHVALLEEYLYPAPWARLRPDLPV